MRDGADIIIVASSWYYNAPAGIFDNDPHYSYGLQWDWGSPDWDYHCYTVASDDIQLFTGGGYNGYPYGYTTSSGIFYNMKEDQSGGGGAPNPSSLQCDIIIPRASNITTQLSTSLQEEMPIIIMVSYPTSEVKVASLISSSKTKILILAFMILCME